MKLVEESEIDYGEVKMEPEVNSLYDFRGIGARYSPIKRWLYHLAIPVIKLYKIRRRGLEGSSQFPVCSS